MIGTTAAAVLSLTASTASASPLVTSIAKYDQGAYLSASPAVTALAMANGDAAALYVGVGGAAPTLAPGASAIPSWGHATVGTDAAGRAVVIYPRRATADVSGCDLYSYDVANKTEAPVAGVNHAGVGEIDGAMTRGAVAFNRWTPTGIVSTPPWTARTNLFYKPAGGKARLLTKKGGRRLGLRGPWIVQLRDTRGEGPDIGNFTVSVELVSTSGKRRTVRRSFVGESGQTPANPTLFSGQVVWASCWSDRAGQLWRYDISERQLTKVSLAVKCSTFSPTTPDTGLGLRWIGTNEHPQTELFQVAGIGPGTKTRG